MTHPRIWLRFHFLIWNALHPKHSSPFSTVRLTTWLSPEDSKFKTQPIWHRLWSAPPPLPFVTLMQSLLCYHTVSHFQSTHNISTSLATIFHLISKSCSPGLWGTSRPQCSSVSATSVPGLGEIFPHPLLISVWCDWKTLLNVLKGLLHFYVFQFELDPWPSLEITIVLRCFFLCCADLFIFFSPSWFGQIWRTQVRSQIEVLRSSSFWTSVISGIHAMGSRSIWVS